MPTLVREPETDRVDVAQQPRPFESLVQSLREYAAHNPEAAALWCLGVGFVLGWKLKPW